MEGNKVFFVGSSFLNPPPVGKGSINTMYENMQTWNVSCNTWKLWFQQDQGINFRRNWNPHRRRLTQSSRLSATRITNKINTALIEQITIRTLHSINKTHPAANIKSTLSTGNFCCKTHPRQISIKEQCKDEELKLLRRRWGSLEANAKHGTMVTNQRRIMTGQPFPPKRTPRRNRELCAYFLLKNHPDMVGPLSRNIRFPYIRPY